MFRSVLQRVVLAGALVLPVQLSAQEGTNAVFDISIAGLPAGQLTLVTERSGNAYRAASRIEASGLVSIFTSFGFDGSATGTVAQNGTVVPQRFVADSQSPRADRHTEIDWERGTPVRVSVEPARASAPDPATQGGTLDPVSAGFAVLGDTTQGEMCNADIDIFDGSRRSKLVLGRPVLSDGQFVCEGSYARIEGEAHSVSDQRSFPFRVVFAPDGAGGVRVERIETSTRFGTAVIRRRG